MNYRLLLTVVFAMVCGCANPQSHPTSVSDRIAHPQTETTATPPPRPEVHPDDVIIARINEQPITRQEFEQLLRDSHGLFVFEQLLALELVRQEAIRENITVSEMEVEQEYELALIELARRVTNDTEPLRLRELGEKLLEGFLRDKNISRKEYALSMRRNAYLRKLAAPSVLITDADIQFEFQRRYGRQAIARHIALADPQEAATVRAQLAAGEDFATLAVQKSINVDSGQQGGLLPAFAENDEQIPLLIRQSVFALQPGQISTVLHIDEQFHIFRLEQLIEPKQGELTSALTEELRQDLVQWRTRQVMQDIERRLLRSALIQIDDEALRQNYFERHPRNPIMPG
ncbi:MAG: Foldase protein PrsA 3 [Phycisphaerae bacterium]|nr:Foldase protein PrsA 3 [Phycisphaerae bacterium]